MTRGALRSAWVLAAFALCSTASPSEAGPEMLVVRRAHGAEHDRFDSSLPRPALDADTLRAGDVVVVTWSPSPRIEECELLLSIDGGRRFPLRISPELEGDAHRYEWRVPNLAVRDAHICLRARVHGREVNGPIGPRFTLVADASRPREPWWFSEEGWWSVPEPGADPAAHGWRSRENGELRAAAASSPIESPGRATATAPTHRTVPRPSAATHAAPPLSRPDTRSFARFHPPRE